MEYQDCVEPEVVVILICSEAEAAEYFAVIDHATKTGKQVIGFWPEGDASEAIPDTINREGGGLRKMLFL